MASAAFAASAVAATPLTDENSVNAPFVFQETGRVAGVGCGNSGSKVFALPAGANAVKVTEPRLGTADSPTRVKEVRVDGSNVTVTGVGEGSDVCDPSASSTPPESRSWSFNTYLDATYRRRVRIGLKYKVGSTKLTYSPKTLQASYYLKALRVKWKRFGSKQATGSGVLKQRANPGLRCTRRTCPYNGKRATIVLDKVADCDAIGVYEYGRLRVFVKGRRILASQDC